MTELSEREWRAAVVHLEETESLYNETMGLE